MPVRLPLNTEFVAEARALREIAARLEAQARAKDAPGSAARRAHCAAPSPCAPAPRWTTLERAAVHAKCHPDTMREMVKRKGLGFKRGGVWKVDLNRVEAFENGLPYEPLPA